MNQYQKHRVLQQKHLYVILIHPLFNNKWYGIPRVYTRIEQIQICLYFLTLFFFTLSSHRDFKSNTARDLHRKHYTNDELNLHRKTSPSPSKKPENRGTNTNEREQTSKTIR